MEFEAATQTRQELTAALKQCVRRPHGNVHHGRLYLSPECFAAAGKETSLCISLFSILDCTGSIHIGPWCMIGARTRIYTHDHFHHGRQPLLAQQEQYGVIWQDKYIGRDVWIHENAIVLYQVTEIPDGVVIGAGAVLTRNPAPYEIWAGVPARKIADRSEQAPHLMSEQAGRGQFSLKEYLKDTWETTPFTTF